MPAAFAGVLSEGGDCAAADADGVAERAVPCSAVAPHMDSSMDYAISVSVTVTPGNGVQINQATRSFRTSERNDNGGSPYETSDTVNEG